MKCIAIIPARGGSKSIHLKNIRDFCGKPLILHSIDLALACSSIERTIVSTDSHQIAEIAIKAGADVPFIRPSEHAQDDTADLPVFIHCIKWLKENENYEPDIIAHMRPTSPLRTLEMLESGINILKENPGTDSVRGMCEPSQNPYKMWSIEKDGYAKPLIQSDIAEQYNQPRQKLPVVYWQNGYVDITRTKTIMEKKLSKVFMLI